MFSQTSHKTCRSQNGNRLNSQCSCKSSQHNVIYKDVAVKTFPLKVSSIFTNTSEFDTHDHGYLQRKQTMTEELNKTRNPRNIRQNFKSNPKKYEDFETYEYQTLQSPKVKRRDISFNGLYNNLNRRNVNNSPCDDVSSKKANDTSNFCDCICDRKEKNTKRKQKNTCLCHATGDYKDDNVENIDSEYRKKVRNKNKVQRISNILDKNKIGLVICEKGICAQRNTQKDNNTFSFKYRTGKVPAKCVDLTCNMNNKIKTTKVKLKDKVIHLGNKYSQKLERLRYPSLQNKNSNQNTFVKGTCDDVLLNKIPGYVYKSTNKDESKDCTDATCNILKNRCTSKSKQAQTFQRESKNKKTGLKSPTNNRFLRCCIAFKAKFQKDIPKNHKIKTYNANIIPNDLKKQVKLKQSSDSKQDQTGEPFFDIKVNSIDMRTLNPNEVRNKVLALGKLEKRKTCICPSHNTKKIYYLSKTACPSGVCKKAFRNKKTNFTCKCANRKVKTCTDTTCELDAQKTKISSWPINKNTPVLEMKLDSHNMNILNTQEIRSKIHDIEKSGKIDKCPSGVCESVTNKARYICKCFHRKRLIEMDECSEDTCRQTNLVKVRNGKNNIKSKISCMCAQILSKSEIWSRQKFNKMKRKSSNIAKTHNEYIKSHSLSCTKPDIFNKNQGLKINFMGKNVDVVNCDSNCSHITEPCINRNDNSRNKSLNEKGDFGLITENVQAQNNKIVENKLHNTDNKENTHRYCNCCVCDVVKSDCKCMNTSRKLKCTDILFRSCSNLFCGRGFRKPKYQRKRLILKTNTEKINMPSSFKNTHAYTENCICCLCGQRSKDCNCQRSLKMSRRKYILCKSFSRLIQSHRQSVTYPENGVTTNRTQIHKRKSISLPIEKMFYRAQSHNTQYNNSKSIKKLKPMSVSFNDKDQRNFSDVTEARKKRKHVHKHNTPIRKKRQEFMHDETKTKTLNENKKQHQSIITQRDKGDKICLCSHICECESRTRRNRLKHGHKKRKLLSKREKLKRRRQSEFQKQKNNKKRGLKRKKVSLANEKKFRKEIAKKEMVRSKKKLKRQKLEKKQLEAISKGQEEVEETSCIADFFLALFKIGFCIIKGIGVVLLKFITDPKGSIRYTKQRLRDPAGTYERIKRAFLEFWGLKKLQIEKSIAGSEKMTILSDALQNTALYQAFADKGKTKKEKKLIDYKNKKRRKRITKRDKEAMHGCRHMLLHTLRKTPCMWVYHVCPHFYPQCLSCLAFWHNFSNLLLFLLAFIVWTPCIVCFEGFRALSCCLLCTG